MIKVWSNTHCSFAASNMVNQLVNLGLNARVVDHLDNNDKDLHILYQVSNKGSLPKNYILMQTEPWHSHWMNEHYVSSTIKNARAVWDYHEDNFQAYEHDRRCIVLPGISPQPTDRKDIPWLFYGHVDGSKRRAEKLEVLQKELKHFGSELEVVTNIVGPKMWDILSRTQTVFNIHYDERGPLEMYRIHEALSFGCVVKTEHGDGWKTIYDCFYSDNLDQIKQGLNLAGI